MNSRVKLIYNPKAGKGTKIIGSKNSTSLEDVKTLLAQYQIPVSLAPTKGPGHATDLAKQAVSQGYNVILVAGGDGTVSEVATGLIGTSATLGILPLGTFMNTARMLNIPTDLELATAIIKMGRTRKIDVAVMSPLPQKQPHYYFLENAGIGLEAQLQQNSLEWEKGDKSAIVRIIKTFFDYYGNRIRIVIDKGQEIVVRAPLVEISNGPYTGAALKFAPAAKLNDHMLTVSVFKMSKWELVIYFLQMLRVGKFTSRKITRYQGKVIQIHTRVPRLVHADARVFGNTPVEFKIMPGALNVFTGFPKKESALVARTPLDP